MEWNNTMITALPVKDTDFLRLKRSLIMIMALMAACEINMHSPPSNCDLNFTGPLFQWFPLKQNPCNIWPWHEQFGPVVSGNVLSTTARSNHITPVRLINAGRTQMISWHLVTRKYPRSSWGHFCWKPQKLRGGWNIRDFGMKEIIMEKLKATLAFFFQIGFHCVKVSSESLSFIIYMIVSLNLQPTSHWIHWICIHQFELHLWGTSLLLKAVEKGNVAMAELLLSAGAVVDVLDNYGAGHPGEL